MTTLVDTSVLLDVMAPSPWREWSEQQLARVADEGDLAINQIVYAELAVGFATLDRLERTVQGVGLLRIGLPWAASWLASRLAARITRLGRRLGVNRRQLLLCIRRACSNGERQARDESQERLAHLKSS